MGESKHTPGPWNLETRDLRGGRFWAVVIPVAEFEDVEIHERENGEANARLIAAAPDMLAALKALLAVVEVEPSMRGRQHVGLGIQVNNAIAKAEGRS